MRELKHRDQASLQAPGVLAVLTGKNVAGLGLGGLPPLFMPEDSGGPKAYRTVRPILVQHTVRHVGDRVAICVAETLEQARDGAELIEIDYEPLASVSGLTEATASGAPLVWDAASTTSASHSDSGDPAATERAFAEASHHVRAQTYEQPSHRLLDGAAWSDRLLQSCR